MFSTLQYSYTDDEYDTRKYIKNNNSFSDF